ncbi:MAG: PspA/IM30 family protein [Candidatus Thiodiazotropha endolucinida]|nr:PspA/IM30 family protein [Candidatus Thiodiazotropha endolucinida]
MKESITNRVGRIISGSVNALLDAVENAAPDLVMEEAIREVDEAIDEVRAELGRVIAGKHLANQRLMDESRKHEELAEKIELAVKEGRDDLAEAAIARQLDIEAQVPVLESTIAEASNQENELEGYVIALQAKRREMREELAQFRKAQEESKVVAVAAGSGQTNADSSVEASVRKAETAFDRVMERATGVGSHSMPDRGDASKLAELDELSRNM